jgi:hypothetical protein
MRFNIHDGVLIKYEKEKSRLKIGKGSWTIKKEWIENPEIFKIKYITEESLYTITKEDALKKGWYLLLGGEDKLVVPIKNWTIDAKEEQHV